MLPQRYQFVQQSLSSRDISAFDLIGYDVWYRGNAGGTVSVSDWTDAEVGDLRDALNLRSRRRVSRSSRTSNRTAFRAEDEQFINGADEFNNFVDELAGDLNNFV